MTPEAPPLVASPEALAGPRDVGGDMGRLVAASLAVVISAAFLVAVATLIQVGAPPGVLCLLAVSVLAVTALPLLYLGRLELYEPLWMVLLVTAVGVTGKAFYLVFGPSSRVNFLLLGKDLGDLHFATLVLALALLSFSLGYLSGSWRWRLPGLSWLVHRDWDQRKLLIAIGVMVTVGFSSFAIFVTRVDLDVTSLGDLSSPRFFDIPGSEHRGSMGYLRWGAMFTELSFYLAFVHWASLRRRFLSLSGILVCTLGLFALAFPIFVSTRQAVLMLLVRSVVIWIIVRGEPKIRYLVAVALAGLILGGSMLTLRRGANDLQDLQSDMGVSTILEFTVGGRHFLDLTKTAHVLEAVPSQLEYRHGETFLTWLVAPIPRTLWPQKPAIGAGKLLGQAVFDAPRFTGVPPGLVAELHLNFGPPAIFIGLLAFGMLLRSLYETFRPTLGSSSGVLLYTVLSTRLALDLVAGQVSGSMAKLLQELIPLLVVMVYVSREIGSGDLSATAVVPSGGAEPDAFAHPPRQ